MPTNYILDSDAQDDMIVSFMLAQERDNYTHTVNKQRYEAMLLTLPTGPFKDRVEMLLAETKSRLSEVTAIIQATRSQLPSPARIAAAIARLKAAKAI